MTTNKKIITNSIIILWDYLNRTKDKYSSSTHSRWWNVVSYKWCMSGWRVRVICLGILNVVILRQVIITNQNTKINK